MDNNYYWDLIIMLEERKSELEVDLPSTSNEEFNEYSMIWDMLGALYQYLGKGD